MALMPPRLTPAEYYALPPDLRAHYVCVAIEGEPIYYMLVFSFGLQYQQQYPANFVGFWGTLTTRSAELERAAPAATVTGSGEIQRSVVALALFENLDDEPLED